MKRVSFGLLAAGMLVFGTSAPGSAQQVEDWWSPVIGSVVGAETQERTGRSPADWRDAIPGRSGPGTVRPDDRYEQRGSVRDGRGAGRGNGSVHCRSGRGHPVKGWDWCRRKGWTDAQGRSWRQAGWGDVILGGPRPTREHRMEQPSVIDVIGDVVLGRLARAGLASGLTGAVDGRWMPLREGGSVLQLRMGGSPLAELADLDRDGRADVVLLREAR